MRTLRWFTLRTKDSSLRIFATLGILALFEAFWFVAVFRLQIPPPYDGQTLPYLSFFLVWAFAALILGASPGPRLLGAAWLSYAATVGVTYSLGGRYPILLTFALAYPGLALGAIIVGSAVLVRRHLAIKKSPIEVHEHSRNGLRGLRDRSTALSVTYLLTVYVVGILYIFYSLWNSAELLYLTLALGIALAVSGPLVASYLKKARR